MIMPLHNQSRDSRRSRVPLAAVTLVVLLAIAWWVLALDSGSHPNVTANAGLPSFAERDEPDAASVSTGHASALAPIETSKVFASKDPFEPLVDLGNAGPATNDSVTGVSAGTSRERDQKATSTTDADDSAAGTSVSVVEVTGSSSVNVDVEGEKFRVVQGDTFAKNFKLLFIHGKCASMLYGDDQFSLCEGEEASK
jgi:hypothetical protein